VTSLQISQTVWIEINLMSLSLKMDKIGIYKENQCGSSI